jgi:aryl-alcohol dehydrogenase-like predicted oxidoreductase
LNDHSIQLFDTAPIYGFGASEKIIGTIMSTEAQFKIKPIIATKFLPMVWNFRQNALRTSLRNSCSRLGVDQVGLMQIHGLKLSYFRDATFWAEALAQAALTGKALAVGVSNYNSKQLINTYEILQKHGIQLASNQIELSLLRNNPDKNGLLQTCKDLNIAVLAYSPLGMGRLTGKYSEANPPPGDRYLQSLSFKSIEPNWEISR